MIKGIKDNEEWIEREVVKSVGRGAAAVVVFTSVRGEFIL